MSEQRGNDRREQRRATQAAVEEQARGQAMRVAIGYLQSGRLVEAEAVVRRHLASRPDDVAALCLLGDLAWHGGVHWEAERLFRLALSHAPFFSEGQLNLAKVLSLRDGIAEAIALLENLLGDEPERWEVALQRLTLLGQVGDYEFAEREYELLLADHPRRAEIWCSFGHLLKTLGKTASCIHAYNHAIELDERQGEAWWGLANLKTHVFSEDEIARMQSIVASSSGSPRLRSEINFALGKALEDRRDFARSFDHYVAGNNLQRRETRYSANTVSEEVARSIGWFTPERFQRCAGAGNPARDPIFIVGLPRAGSTLVEQILASHSSIEGTAELPYIPMLVHRLLSEHWQDKQLTFPRVLDTVPTDRLAAIGQAYLDAAAVHRREDAPFFIDKLPNNWAYVGFIRMILPNARIVDARRSAMDCCWSNYKQWFARGQEFSYDFNDLGRYYRDYVALMDHFDHVMPSPVRRVVHEQLIADPEKEIRDLLTDLELPFEAACLASHENSRPVRTASAQQVRRPINRDAVDRWRSYEPWLDELKAALGAR